MNKSQFENRLFSTFTSSSSSFRTLAPLLVRVTLLTCCKCSLRLPCPTSTSSQTSFLSLSVQKMMKQWCCLFLLFILTVDSASVDSKHGHERVVKDHKLSHKEHFHGQDHDYDYDHEAFLGADEAREFDQLAPEESRARLGTIVDKIDSNEDGMVSLDEMRDWIRFTQQRYVSEDVDRQWNQHNADNKETITWQEYRQLVYGFLDEDFEDNQVDEDTVTYQ